MLTLLVDTQQYNKIFKYIRVHASTILIYRLKLLLLEILPGLY